MVRLRRLARRHPSGALSDLTWAKLTPWREFVSQFFDSPAFRSRLKALDNVEIEYVPNGPDGPAQSLLFLGWLGACLGWTPDSDTVPVEWPAHGRFRRPDGQFVEFTASPEGEEAVAGLRRIVLRAGDSATFRVTRDDDGHNALTEAIVDGGQPLQRMARFESPDLSGSLASELMIFSRDHVYDTALAVAVTLAGGVTQPPAR
jgi:glucose-6-phosphate dehydrogenase assembly protein OpcA